MVPAVMWTPTDEVLALGDDHKITRWDAGGALQGEPASIDAAITDAHWFPSVGGAAADVFVVSCTDGW